MTAQGFERFQDRPCPAWFATPQLGIFIHWGLYSVPAWAPRGRSLDVLLREDFDNVCALQPYAEWYANAITLPDSPSAQHHAKVWNEMAYEGFRPIFDAAAEAFDAEAWVDLFVAAGARYVVFVAKHHDGYCLWPTEVANPHRPGWHSQRDFVGELAAATRARGLKFGLYYSGGLDWTFHHAPIRNLGDMLACIPTGNDYREYAAAQLRELIDRYAPSVIWNDIGWPNSADLPALFDHYYSVVPDGVINDRWTGDPAMLEGLQDAGVRAQFNARIKAAIAAGASIMSVPPHADFRTIEYGLGTPPENKKWEACRGIGLAFGHNRNEIDDDFLTHQEFGALRDDVSRVGGNFLINVGPMADSTIPEIQRKALLG
jgi:alpha-L-fucosidase